MAVYVQMDVRTFACSSGPVSAWVIVIACVFVWSCPCVHVWIPVHLELSMLCTHMRGCV